MSPKRKSKLRKWIIIGVLAAIIAAIGVAFWLRSDQTSYESVVAETGDITTFYTFAGNVETKNRQTVMSEKVMQVSAIKVKEGDIIEEGTVLIKTTAGDEIKSKIRGEIVTINVEENAQVMAGTKLLEIVDYDNLEIKVKVDEYDVAAFQNGKEATVTIGAINKEFKGKISSTSREGQIMNGVTFFTATIDLEKDQRIRIGMSAEVKLISDQAAQVVTLPMTAIQFEQNNQPYVFKKDKNEEIVKNEITTGINDGTKVEVKSGVQSGETIFYPKPVVVEEGGFRPGGGQNRDGFDGGDR